MAVSDCAVSRDYHLSRWASTYVGWNEEPLVIGLLGTIAFVWMYTYAEMNEMRERMRERIDRLEQALWESGVRPQAK